MPKRNGASFEESVLEQDADETKQSNLDLLKERFAAHNQIDPILLIAVLNDLSGIENPAPAEETAEEGDAE